LTSVGVDFFYGTAIQDYWLLMGDNAMRVIPGKETHFIVYAGSPLDELSKGTVLRDVSFGQKLVDGKGILYLSIQSAKDWVDVVEKRVFRIGGVPVFVATR
jgi:hypothetical protein